MNAKIYTGNIQPNPKEYKVWVNDEGVIKTWNGTEWIEQSGESGGTASKYAPRYYDISKVSAIQDFAFAASFKGKNGTNTYIFPPSLTAMVRCEKVLAFSFVPMYIDFGNGNQFMYDAIEFIRIMVGNDEEANEMLSLITEITEEEFYKID